MWEHVKAQYVCLFLGSAGIFQVTETEGCAYGNHYSLGDFSEYKPYFAHDFPRNQICKTDLFGAVLSIFIRT